MNKPSSGGIAPPLMTETMAQLLLEQRHWREAIKIYRELGRKHPEKAAGYQKKISEIKQFFAPDTANSTGDTATCERTHRQIRHLKKLLQRLEKSRIAKE